MAAERLIPEFASEAEEAKWWFANQDRLDAEFAEAAAQGTLGHGRAAGSAGLPVATVQLDPEDVVLASKQAHQRGVQYQAYVRELLHDALMREQKTA